MLNKRPIIIFILALIIFAFMPATTSANISIGVKKGDWIEYQVQATGTFPGEHNLKWARIDVVDAQGITADLNITAQLTNGTFVYQSSKLDFQTGELLEGFFIPADSLVGDVVFDSLVQNITITEVSQKAYAGASRLVLLGITPYTIYHWDERTGVLVEAQSFYPNENYAITTIIDKTNLWQPQIFGLDPIFFYAIVTAIITAVIVTAALALLLRRKKAH